jgi:hypothetical protein
MQSAFNVEAEIAASTALVFKKVTSLCFFRASPQDTIQRILVASLAPRLSQELALSMPSTLQTG